MAHRLRDAHPDLDRDLGFDCGGQRVGARHVVTQCAYVLKECPQISQTYIEAEMEALEADYDIAVVTRKAADIPFTNHHEFRSASTAAEVRAVVDEVKPDLIHCHYLDMLHIVGPVARDTGTPFSMRPHSYDTLAMNPKNLLQRARQRRKIGLAVKVQRRGVRPSVAWRARPLGQAPHFREGLPWLNHPLCLGVLAFPYARPWLTDAGVLPTKITDVFPVIAFERFHDRARTAKQ
jgi:hypothetical protein